MIRYVVAALFAIAAVGAIGYAVYSKTVGAVTPVATTPEPRPVPPLTTPEHHADAPLPQTTKVVATTGLVEKRAGAQWVALREGDQLTAQDTIRTAADAHATLDAGMIVEVDDRTELTVGEISASISQLALSEGRVTANAGARGGQTIRISTRDTDAIAETDAGRFDVLSSGKGQVTVTAREGAVTLTAKGTTITVPEGQLSIVARGKVPTTPSAIPTSLFLKVSAASAARDTTGVRGQTTPGAVVSINGVRTAMASDGTFTGAVPVRKGENTIIVQVEDALGRRERKLIQRPTASRPSLETQVEWE